MMVVMKTAAVVQTQRVQGHQQRAHQENQRGKLLILNIMLLLVSYCGIAIPDKLTHDGKFTNSIDWLHRNCNELLTQFSSLVTGVLFISRKFKLL